MHRTVYTISYKSKIIYVGSTTDMNKRKSTHKYSCLNSKKKNKLRIYKVIRKLGIKENTFFKRLQFNTCGVFKEDEAKILESILIKALCPIGNVKKRVYNSIYGDKELRKDTKKEWQKSNHFREYQREYQRTDKFLTKRRQSRAEKLANMTDEELLKLKAKRKEYKQRYKAKKAASSPLNQRLIVIVKTKVS